MQEENGYGSCYALYKWDDEMVIHLINVESWLLIFFLLTVCWALITWFEIVSIDVEA